MAPGRSHQCAKVTRRENLTELVRSSSEGSKSSITVSTLKGMAEEQNISTKGGTVELKSHSKILPVQLGSSRVRPAPSKFSHESLIQLQASLNMSDNSIK